MRLLVTRDEHHRIVELSASEAPIAELRARFVDLLGEPVVERLFEQSGRPVEVVIVKYATTIPNRFRFDTLPGESR